MKLNKGKRERIIRELDFARDSENSKNMRRVMYVLIANHIISIKEVLEILGDEVGELYNCSKRFRSNYKKKKRNFETMLDIVTKTGGFNLDNPNWCNYDPSPLSTYLKSGEIVNPYLIENKREPINLGSIREILDKQLNNNNNSNNMTDLSDYVAEEEDVPTAVDLLETVKRGAALFGSEDPKWAGLAFKIVERELWDNNITYTPHEYGLILKDIDKKLLLTIKEYNGDLDRIFQLYEDRYGNE